MFVHQTGVYVALASEDKIVYSIFRSLWGIGTAGSALRSQCRGQGFESPMLHQTANKVRRLRAFFVLGYCSI